MTEWCPAAKPSLRRVARGLASRLDSPRTRPDAVGRTPQRKQPRNPEHDPVTLCGNVGRDANYRVNNGRKTTRMDFDPAIDDFVERSFTAPSREARMFTLAVSANDDNGNLLTRWIFCDVRKRTYTKTARPGRYATSSSRTSRSPSDTRRNRQGRPRYHCASSNPVWSRPGSVDSLPFGFSGCALPSAHSPRPGATRSAAVAWRSIYATLPGAGLRIPPG